MRLRITSPVTKRLSECASVHGILASSSVHNQMMWHNAHVLAMCRDVMVQSRRKVRKGEVNEFSCFAQCVLYDPKAKAWKRQSTTRWVNCSFTTRALLSSRKSRRKKVEEERWYRTVNLGTYSFAPSQYDPARACDKTNGLDSCFFPPNSITNGEVRESFDGRTPGPLANFSKRQDPHA